jgi:hypothetical protein
MGIVIPFKPRLATARVFSNDEKRPVLDAVRSGGDRGDILVAARPLLGRCHRQYGFSVMADGLPEDPQTLCDAIFLLADGLDLLASEVKGPVRWSFGAYFGQAKLAWVDDSYGGNADLAVPLSITPAELAQFIRPRLVKRRA